MLVDEKGPASAGAGAEVDIPESSLKQVPWSFSPQRYRDTSRMIHFYLKQAEPPPSTPSLPETPEPVMREDVSQTSSEEEGPETATKRSRKSRRGRGLPTTKRMSLRSVTLRRRRSRAMSKNRQ